MIPAVDPNLPGLPFNAVTSLASAVYYLNSHLNHRVTTFSNAVNVMQEASSRFPRVFPIASPNVILDNLRQLVSDLRRSGDRPHGASSLEESSTTI